MIQNVQPGGYLLMARSQNRGTPAPAMARIEALQAAGLQSPNLQISQSSNSDQWGQLELAVAGKDLSEVALALQPGMTLSGRVVFEGAAPPDSVADLGVPARRPRPDAMGGAIPTGHATSAGTFILTGVVPGLYLMSAGQCRRRDSLPLPGGW